MVRPEEEENEAVEGEEKEEEGRTKRRWQLGG